MICLHPKNVHGVLYPCGKCPVCRQSYRQALASRFRLESCFCKSNFFLTLTYNDENLPLCSVGLKHNEPIIYPCFWKPHIDLFLKNLRKKFSFRFFCTAEHGSDLNRPHYHLLIFSDKKFTLHEFTSLCEKYWSYGFVQVSFLSASRCAYAAKYALKEDLRFSDLNKYDLRRPFTLFSRRPGIGSSAVFFVSDYIDNGGNTRDSINIFGENVRLDRYMRTHIDAGVDASYLDMTYWKNFRKSQNELLKSYHLHKDDYTADYDILKRREALKKLKHKSL